MDDLKLRYRDGLDLVLQGVTCSVRSGEKVSSYTTLFLILGCLFFKLFVASDMVHFPNTLAKVSPLILASSYGSFFNSRSFCMFVFQVLSFLFISLYLPPSLLV